MYRSVGSAGVFALIAATLLWWPRLTHNETINFSQDGSRV